MSKPFVHILLSTFNGAAYLREQLDSLVRQTYPHIKIHVRDDGSRDATPEILREYTERYPHIEVIFGKNIGVNRSYHELLGVESATVDLFAFCDQDDVWDEDKIQQAVKLLSQKPNDDSCLYLSRYRFVDEELQTLRTSCHRRHLSFSNAVVESGVAGCTMVFGSTLKDIMRRSDPDAWNMHDWWAYLAATAFGEVLFDPEPRLSYRRHASNTTDWEQAYTKRVIDRLQLFSQRRKTGTSGLISLQQAGRFVRQYEDTISPGPRDLVLELEGLRNENVLRRIGYTIRSRVRRERIFENLVLLLVIALGQH